MIPEKVGRYEIQYELGRGGMATVYFAYDPRFKRDVAVKILPPEFLHDPAFRARFQREAQTIASLEHPAIVPVYDFGEDAALDQPYLVMRYLPGGSLAARLKQGPLALDEAIRLIAHLAPALDEAHARSIVHRDLKPANILFDRSGNPYISDFGLAKLSDAGRSASGSFVVGTPAYMSPEQARGVARLDGRSDVYALGIILFEMLAGRAPYEADTPIAIALMHITEPVPRIRAVKPDLPPDCEAVVARALAKDREQRFMTASQMVEALERIVRTDAVSPTPTSGVTTVILPPDKEAFPSFLALTARRHRQMIGLGLATGLAACGVLSTLLSTGNAFPVVFPPASTPAHTWAATQTVAATASRPAPTSAFPILATSTLNANPSPTRQLSLTSTPRAQASATLPISATSPATASLEPPAPPSDTPVPSPSHTLTPTATATPVDMQGPTISGLDANPTTVGALNGCSVTFSAAISDPSMVVTASVNWASFDALGRPSGSGSATMSGPAAGGTWMVTFNVSIPPSGHLEWGVTASDEVGNSATQADGPPIMSVARCR